MIGRARALALLVLLHASPGAAQEPTRELAGGARCQVSEPVALGASSLRTLRPALALGPDGRGLAVWASADVLHVRALGGDEPGALREVELERGAGRRARALAGPGFVAVVTEAARVELFRVTAEGAIARESHSLGGECPAETTIEALAVDRGATFALGRADCAEGPRFLLRLGGRREPLVAIPEGAEVRRFTVRSGVATVVYRLERGRRRLVRLAVEGGRVVEGPIALRPDALPLDVEDVVDAEVVTERDRLVLQRTDLAGTPIGEPVDLAPASGHPVTRLAWDGRRFVVLVATHAARRWTIEVRVITCPAA